MIDRLIEALNRKAGMSAEEIADMFWLAVQIQESESEPEDTDFSPGEDRNDTDNIAGESEPITSPEQQLPSSNSEETTTKRRSKEQTASIYPQKQGQISKTDLSFKAPNAPSLREPLTLARALKPLMRRVPAGTNFVLDEAATTQRIADEGLWLPVLRPTLEPWLDLELVVDESISMQIWRQTIGDLEKLLKNYGIFRDVRVWGLIADDGERVQIRRGIGARAKSQAPRSPKELIDSSGRRLVLVVSDCVSPLWRDGKVTATLELWANRVPTAIIQMLPQWLWKRTALGRATEVRLRALTPGVSNQNLIAKVVSLWDEPSEERRVKVPVFTLEADKAATWAQMLSGKGSVWTSGVAFELDGTPVNQEDRLFNLDYSQLTAEQRVQAFRVTASPMARKLAGLLAAAPVITLPVVRLIREVLLKDSLQVNVAEVFLGGLLKPLSEIEVETNPDEVLYDFMDGVRELLVDSVPSGYVLDVVDEVSEHIAERAGWSLETFAAVLRNPQEVGDSRVAEEVRCFATVSPRVLRRLGGEYAKVADELESNSVTTIPDNQITTEFEEKRHFLWQEGNTKIYSVCTNRAWSLPFDALVIPMGFRIFGDNKLLPGGGFSRGFYGFLGENFMLFERAVDRALGENKNKQPQISPSQPLLVALPAEINDKLSLLNGDLANRFVIITTVEDLEASVSNTGQAVNSIIALAKKQGLKRILLPLIGTGYNLLSIEQTANEILVTIVKTLKESSSSPIETIIFVGNKENVVETINQVASDLFLPTEKGINYTQLQNLLSEGKWKEADEETARLMFKIAERENEGWLRVEDIEQFPCSDLQTIDRLWTVHSKNRFGFSVQKSIWQEMGQKVNIEAERKLGETVGWFNVDEFWLQYSNLTFSLDAPTGHLPAAWDYQGIDGQEAVSTCLLMSRLLDCVGSEELANILNRDALKQYLEGVLQRLKQQGCSDIRKDVVLDSRKFNYIARMTEFELAPMAGVKVPFELFYKRGEAFFMFSEFASFQMETLQQFSSQCFDWAREQVKLSATLQAIYKAREPAHICFAIAIVDELDEETRIAIRTTNPFNHLTDLLWYVVPVVYELEREQLLFYESPKNLLDHFLGGGVWDSLRKVMRKYLMPSSQEARD